MAALLALLRVSHERGEVEVLSHGPHGYAFAPSQDSESYLCDGAVLTSATASAEATQQEGPRQYSCRGAASQAELQLHGNYSNQVWHETTVKFGHRVVATATGCSYRQLQQGAAAAVTFPRLFPGATSALNAGNAMRDGRGESW